MPQKCIDNDLRKFQVENVVRLKFDVPGTDFKAGELVEIDSCDINPMKRSPAKEGTIVCHIPFLYSFAQHADIYYCISKAWQLCAAYGRPRDDSLRFPQKSGCSDSHVVS